MGGGLDSVQDHLRVSLSSVSLRAQQLSMLRLLMTVISDQDVAIEAGARGLHADLMRLSESHDEDISEAACACVAACIAALPEGRGFPAPRASYTTYPAAPYRVRLGDYVGGPLADETRPWLPRDPRWRNADAASVRRAIDTLDSIWVRPIPSSVRRQRGQEDVGHVLWPAAPVLSRWIVAHRALWAPRSCHGCGNRRGVRTLELGAASQTALAAVPADEGRRRGRWRS